ncbi:MAG: helicase [Verrucomicrobia bacterium]|nr:helicase [Verrucomicrobiota bacterium]
MAKILYHAVPVPWRKEEKYARLETTASIAGVKWTKLTPDKKGNWITNDTDEEFDTFLPIGSKEAKAGTSVPTVFRTYSLGVSTNRDAVVYDFDAKRLAKRVEQFADDYNAELHRWQKKGRPKDVDNFVSYEKIKWSETLKRHLTDEVEAKFSAKFIRKALYRPFTELSLYNDTLLIDRPGMFDEFFPTKKSETENSVICLSDVGLRSPFSCLATDKLPDLHLCASTDGFQCFPLFTCTEDGKERRDNITPKALTLFQIFYDDDGITRADIFHYFYALLHHPAYRTRYAENLKRELPRIPFVGVVGRVSPLRAAGGASVLASRLVSSLAPPAQFFPLAAVEKMQGDATPDHNPKASAKLFHAFAAAGQQLADLHANYESAKEFPLKRQENKAVKLDWRVEAMKLSKDKVSLFYNDFLTLSGIPAEVYDYRLGNRSALEWVIDQYRVTKDENGNITSDPNRPDDEQHIVRLIGQVITVSVETQKIIHALPGIAFAAEEMAICPENQMA